MAYLLPVKISPTPRSVLHSLPLLLCLGDAPLSFRSFFKCSASSPAPDRLSLLDFMTISPSHPFRKNFLNISLIIQSVARIFSRFCVTPPPRLPIPPPNSALIDVLKDYDVGFSVTVLSPFKDPVPITNFLHFHFCEDPSSMGPSSDLPPSPLVVEGWAAMTRPPASLFDCAKEPSPSVAPSSPPSSPPVQLIECALLSPYRRSPPYEGDLNRP